MQIKPKSVKRIVDILTDPIPDFIANVDKGANQAPWKSLKSRDGKESQMAVKTQGTKTPVVRALRMSKEVFKTDQSAIDYLTKKNWDEDSYDLYDGEDQWIAKSTETFAEGEISKTRSVTTKDNGVFMDIAEVTKAGTDGEQDQEVTEEDVEDLAPAVPPGSDGLPPVSGAIYDSGVPNSIASNPAAGVARSVKAKKPIPTSDDQNDTDLQVDDKPAKSMRKLAKVRRVTPIPEGAVAAAKTVKTAAEDRVLEFRGELAAKYDWFGAYMSDDTSLQGVMKDGMSYDSLPPGVDTVLDAVYCTASNILGDAQLTDKGAALKQLGTDFAEITMGLYELFNKAAADTSGDESTKKFAESFRASIQAATKKALVPTEIVVAEPVNKNETVDIASVIAGAVTKALGGFKAEIGALSANVSKATSDIAAIQSATPRKKGLSGVFDDLAVEPTQKTDNTAATDRLRAMMGGRPEPTVRH